MIAPLLFAQERDFGLECLAMVAYTEQNELQPEGMGLVARTVLNRVQDNRFSGSICSVTTELGQFEGLTVYPVPRSPGHDNPRRWAQALRAASGAIQGWEEMPGHCLSDKPILWFHSGPRPAWANQKLLVCYADGHYFYSDR